MRRARLLAAALAMLLSAAWSAPSYADTPTDLMPVEGGQRSAQAPPVTTGRYVDHTVASSSQRVYRFSRTIPGSTLMVGVTLLSDEYGARRARLSGLIGYKAADGTEVNCGRFGNDVDARPQKMPLVTRAAYSLGRRADCAGEDLLISVFTPEGSAIPAGTAYELDVWELPPVENVAAMPFTGYGVQGAFTPTEPTTSLVPGRWRSEAPLLTPGESVHVDLPLGRVAWFAADVGFNQSVDALATVEDPDGTSGGAGVELRIVSPVGGVVGVPPIDADTYQPTATIGTAPARVESRTYLVSPRSRTDYSYLDHFGGQQAMGSQPGTFYVAVYAVDLTGDEDATLPMTLTTEVRDAQGGFADGADPSYAAPVPELPAPVGGTSEPYDAAAPRADPVAAPTQDGTDTPLAGGLLAGAVAFAGLGVVLLRRGRTQPGAQPKSR